jgi:peptidoglycan/xylan/chitin deacetylase (PgdA/CDA1 family)
MSICLSCAALLMTVTAPVSAPTPFAIAITVDDLPAHGQLPPGMTRLGIAKRFLATLRRHRVPQAYGFVNAARIGKEPGAAAALDAWRQAGYPLGNHTYSHMNLGRAVSLAAWEADVVAGEPAISSRMQGADWRVLRFPNLSTGEGERQQAAFAFLRARGYRIADVSVAFSDWDYSDAYARCLAKRDTATIARMKARYFRGVDAAIARMKAVSAQVYGRTIPQVLLLHIGGWTAVTLPEVLTRLERAGAHYVTLEQAERDPAYAAQGGGALMDRTARRRGIDLTDIPASQSAGAVKGWCR